MSFRTVGSADGRTWVQLSKPHSSQRTEPELRNLLAHLKSVRFRLKDGGPIRMVREMMVTQQIMVEVRDE